jgi:hypothetical protein
VAELDVLADEPDEAEAEDEDDGDEVELGLLVAVAEPLSVGDGELDALSLGDGLGLVLGDVELAGEPLADVAGDADAGTQDADGTGASAGRRVAAVLA